MPNTTLKPHANRFGLYDVADIFFKKNIAVFHNRDTRAIPMPYCITTGAEPLLEPILDGMQRKGGFNAIRAALRTQARAQSMRLPW